MVINPATGQLLKYEDLSVPAAGKGRRSHLAVDAHLFGEHDVLSARTDLLDCQVHPRCTARHEILSVIHFYLTGIN